jgi:hypothetical protein
MAKHTYRIASDDGAERYGAEVGAVVDLDLTADQRRAVVAAGWVEPNDNDDSDGGAQAPKSSSTKGGKS